MVGVTAAALLAGCAVGPDFERPAAPDAKRYTREPLSTGTVSAPIAGGEAQKFVTNMRIPDQWWTLFHSHELNALIERSIKSNPTSRSIASPPRIARGAAKLERDSVRIGPQRKDRAALGANTQASGSQAG